MVTQMSALAVSTLISTLPVQSPVTNDKSAHKPIELRTVAQFDTTITGYNTVPSQTWGNPCMAANGENICGLDRVAACPRRFEFGTLLRIRGNVYRCVDRLAYRYDHRVDINCDKDLRCPARVHGWETVEVVKYVETDGELQ